jgi:hypothetical protein
MNMILGAAYGLAGFIKGLGILAVKQYNVLTELTEAIQDKSDAKRREGTVRFVTNVLFACLFIDKGALFGLEMLTSMLGRLFEVYIVNILPHLLLCFADHDAKVREAAEDCARAIMSKLTSHGVKIVLPGLLKGLESDLWRTKCGAVELLGTFNSRIISTWNYSRMNCLSFGQLVFIVSRCYGSLCAKTIVILFAKYCTEINRSTYGFSSACTKKWYTSIETDRICYQKS